MGKQSYSDATRLTSRCQDQENYKLKTITNGLQSYSDKSRQTSSCQYQENYKLKTIANGRTELLRYNYAKPHCVKIKEITN